MMMKRWLAICLAVFLCGCRDSDDERAVEPLESSRNVLRLNAADQQRLGIVIVPARRETIEVTKSAVGWLEVPPAAQTVVRSPVNGFLVPKDGVDWPLLGQELQANAELANVNIFLTPQEVTQLVMAKEDNDIQMQQALVTMELSESQLKQVTDAREAVAGKRRDAILIPRSALLYNEFGQASCFVVNDADEFVRKRVELRDRRDEFVEVQRGIEADDNVVAIGGQQLAADESKADLAVEDDD